MIWECRSVGCTLPSLIVLQVGPTCPFTCLGTTASSVVEPPPTQLPWFPLPRQGAGTRCTNPRVLGRRLFSIEDVRSIWHPHWTLDRSQEDEKVVKPDTQNFTPLNPWGHEAQNSSLQNRKETLSKRCLWDSSWEGTRERHSVLAN